MKKTFKLCLITGAMLVLGACSQSETAKKDSIANPIIDPIGHTVDTINLGNDMKKNIQDSVNKENDKLNNALNENDMNATNNKAGDKTELVKKYPYALIKTNLGDIKVKFDSANAPMTVENFLKLADSKFYDGTKFHRVIKGFMIQGGDPLSKDDSKMNMWGTGGPGYKFADELKGTEKYTQGTLAMANSGKDTNGSQFFIVTANPGVGLPPSYTVFGSVVSGLDVALKIENAKTGANDRPVENVVIKSVSVLEK